MRRHAESRLFLEFYYMWDQGNSYQVASCRYNQAILICNVTDTSIIVYKYVYDVLISHRAATVTSKYIFAENIEVETKWPPFSNSST